MVTNRSVHFARFDGRPMTIDAFFQGVFGLANILDITNLTRDEIYYVRGCTSNGAIGLMGGTRCISIERVCFLNMSFANYTFGCTLEKYQIWQKEKCPKGKPLLGQLSHAGYGGV